MIGRSAVSRVAIIAGSFAVGALCAAIYREQSKKARKHADRTEVATWEGEGGSAHGVITPSPAVDLRR